MGTLKNLCPDCKNTRSECICTDTCDFCGRKEVDCHCGLDHDPYGNRIYDNKQWHVEMENEQNMHDAYKIAAEFQAWDKESLAIAEQAFEAQAEIARRND